jgi:outer membrane immunogenic protein
MIRPAGLSPHDSLTAAQPGKRWVRAVAVLLLVLASVAAGAADSARADPRASTSAMTWTGFYVGGNVGYGWADAKNDWNFFAPTFHGVTDCSGITHGGGSNAMCASGSDSNGLKGLIGGFQAGYNWQSGQFVAGIVADYQLSDQKGNGIFNALFPINSDGGTVSATYSEKLSWFGTLRGKLGLTVDRSLFYATGGFAYGEVNMNGSATATVDLLVNSPPAPFASWNQSTIKTGWAIGGGMEQSIDRNWSLMIEYLYVDLGSVSANFATIGGNYGQFGNASNAVLAGTGTVSSRVTDNIVRFGINYRIN